MLDENQKIENATIVDDNGNLSESEKQLQVINNSVNVFKGAGKILLNNQERSAKAEKLGQSIISDWDAAYAIENEEQRMAALKVIDERSNKFLLNCSTVLKEENDARKLITQLMDNFKGYFTAAENKINATKPDSFPAKVQVKRNGYAVMMNERAEQERKAIELKANQNKERIEFRTAFEKSIVNKLQELLLAKKTSIQDTFNGITLETFDAKKMGLQNMITVPPVGDDLKNKLSVVAITLRAAYIQPVDIEDIKKESIDSYNYSDFTGQWQQELQALKEKLINELPSKQEELLEEKRIKEEQERLKREELDRQEKERIANEKRLNDAKNEEEKLKLAEQQRLQEEENKKRLEQIENDRIAQEQQLQKEKEEREQREQQQMVSESNQKIKEGELAADMEATGATTMNLFDTLEQTSSVATVNSKTDFEINILQPGGAVQIFQLWFEHVGIKDSDAFLKTSGKQMKAFCEKLYKDKGTKIEGSALEYKPVVKAVTTKVKK